MNDRHLPRESQCANCIKKGSESCKTLKFRSMPTVSRRPSRSGLVRVSCSDYIGKTIRRMS